MSDEQQQAVVEKPDEQAPPASEETGAQEQQKPDPLEELLAQYDEGVSEPQEQQQTPSEPETVSRDEFEALRRDLTAVDTERDMKEAISAIRGDTGFGKDSFVEAWLDGEARDDPRLAKAWQDRRKDPKGFSKIMSSLAVKYAEEVKSVPDPNVTEDLGAVAAAVRGASKQAPSTEFNYEAEKEKAGKMSDAELEKYKRDLARQAGY